MRNTAVPEDANTAREDAPKTALQPELKQTKDKVASMEQIVHKFITKLNK